MTTTGDVTYATSWPRSVVLAMLALLAVGGMLGLMRANVLASAVTYQGSSAKFSSSRVTGEDVGFGMANMTSKDGSGALSTKKVLRAGFATGSLNGFCLSQVQSLPVIGPVTIKVTAGDNDSSTSEIQAVNVQFDLAELRGTGGAAGNGVNLDGKVHIGLASSDVTTLPGADNPLDAPTLEGGQGYFGIDATKGDLFNLRGALHNAEIGGPMALPNLQITVVPGGSQCDTDALPN